MALANRSIGYDEVEARDLRFNLDKDSVPRYWMNNDPWSTSFFNSILAAVPDGERWVMQCVRQSLTRLQDESVRKAGIAFIKQEHYHAREHDDMNNALIAQGVPLDVVERSFKRIRGTLERLTPPDMHLSMMAAFEHFTATFAAVFIDNPDMLDNSDKKVAAMLYWHFVEETEHKSVTFDVFQDAVGSYPQRVAGMLIASAIFLPMVEGHMLYLLYKEKQLLNWRSMLSCLKLQVGPKGLLTRLFAGHYFPYYLPSFHPWDDDNRSQIRKWKEAFNATGDTAKAYEAFLHSAGTKGAGVNAALAA
ncbi:MAG: metal-dependent hydrolase [Gammaproteobacteria bacterium]|jgi:predicted metal-dependent hydrolase|nr:metal-dependent hydrolase [Gammaproteobacteria bacterium]|tara:strand:- start:15384 stop:16298 length:915 start_codon:yes stop_codon:yes gene_type:complete